MEATLYEIKKDENENVVVTMDTYTFGMVSLLLVTESVVPYSIRETIAKFMYNDFDEESKTSMQRLFPRLNLAERFKE